MGAIKVFLKEVVLPITLAFCLASFLKPIYMLTAYATTPYVDLALDYRSASGGCASGSFPAVTVSPAQSASSH